MNLSYLQLFFFQVFHTGRVFAAIHRIRYRALPFRWNGLRTYNSPIWVCELAPHSNKTVTETLYGLNCRRVHQTSSRKLQSQEALIKSKKELAVYRLSPSIQHTTHALIDDGPRRIPTYASPKAGFSESTSLSVG